MLKQRILDISYKHKLGHLGSCFSTLPILYGIYRHHKNDVIILSNGHAGLAQYVCLEHFFLHDAEELYLQHGTHPCYDPKHNIYCSTGSLGMGLPVAIGYALAGQTTHCVISDGECAEGSIWESLNFLDRNELPISVYVNINGFSAYQETDINLSHKLFTVYPKIKIFKTTNYPLPDDISSHYHNINREEYEKFSSLVTS